MSGFVVDASVAVKWLIGEAYSEQAARLLEDEDTTLVAPELLFAEVGNALWALSRRGDITPADCKEAVAVLKAAPLAIPSSLRQLAAAAGQLALDLDHPVYDCVYPALALQENYPVVTANQRFLDKVRQHPYLAARVVHVAELP